MDAERTRAFLLTLSNVVETGSETGRWGDKLVFRVGAQADGGKMFAQFDFVEDGRAMLSFAAGPERFRELLEREGVLPARTGLPFIGSRWSIGMSSAVPSWKSCFDVPTL